MKMANLAMAKANEAQEAAGTPAQGTNEQFPYGTRLELDHDTLAKMGHGTPPSAGSRVTIMGHGKVTHSGTHDDGDGPRHNVSVQMERMGMDNADEETANKAGAAKAMYPSSGE